MEYELTTVWVLALLVSGLIAGFVNTIAGGGSMLTLPALMMLGMPADLANATNRIGVLLQSLTAMKGFREKQRLDTPAIIPILIPSLLGALVGAVLASILPVTVLKPVLLGTMILMAVYILFKPTVVMQEEGAIPFRVQERPTAIVGLFLTGVYGGFIQAGVGFLLIAALAGGLGYDLVRSNALKTVCTAALSVAALAVFIVQGQVLWIPGFILAIGSMTGAALSVNFAIAVPQSTLKWILFTMVCLTCAGAYFQ